MLAKVSSCAVIGLEGAIVEVEVDTGRGLPSLTIVGLPDAAVKESGERVRSAIKNANLAYPGGRVTVNLAPADLRKEGPAYDLPIAVALLIASQQIFPPEDKAIFIGELSLDGSVRHVKGVLPMASFAKEQGFTTLFVPQEDAPEASLIHGLTVIPVDHLASLAGHLRGLNLIPPYQSTINFDEVGDPPCATDFQEVKGQEHVKRALEVAAAGGHNVLMIGPPGAGKTLLARAVPGILPHLTLEEALDITRIYSVADMLPPDAPLVRHRPFRAPHHTISHAGLVGGGRWPRPGEISLAHRGVLFLDELPEFGSHVLEVMRQPMEDKVVTISRAQGALTFPANFMLIAAMNPCPCGYFGDPVRECTCSLSMVSKYQKRVSGPLMDRIDIHVEVPRVEYDKLSSDRLGEPSAKIRARVEKARERQRQRFTGTKLACNADMGPAEVREFCRVDEAGKSLLRAAMQQLQMSARAYHRILKLARTIADLAGSERIETAHLAEAIQYRPRRQV
ncbi:MAG: YifB family Mg chelatase-like AAA ATPase [Anaerolineae bacterium]|jgi:magnesium chelatase family protein|nr:YifB family Mg chelatase-like AAA ATPase [Anaerolineae bacterium]MDH7473573.1 YifB family Mg chelatase-like AAA ATPase [Anaerolineae bacterium]